MMYNFSSAALSARLDPLLDAVLQQQRLVGAVVLVRQRGQDVYRRAAGYLDREAGTPMREDAVFRLASVSKPIVSTAALALVVFGVGGVAGNLFAGRQLDTHVLRTVVLQPVLLGLAYWRLFQSAGSGIGWAALAVLVLFWGAAHTSGLIETQVWLSSEAREAPAFAIGVYIAAINLGVTVGAVAGGMAIARYGMQCVIASGLLLALLLIVLKAWRYCSHAAGVMAG